MLTNTSAGVWPTLSSSFGSSPLSFKSLFRTFECSSTNKTSPMQNRSEKPVSRNKAEERETTRDVWADGMPPLVITVLLVNWPFLAQEIIAFRMFTKAQLITILRVNSVIFYSIVLLHVNQLAQKFSIITYLT